VLNRVFRFTRRQEPQAFPPRKRSMADSCFGQPDPEVSELDTFVEDALPPGAPLLPAPQQPVAAPPQAGHLLPLLSKQEAAPTPAARQEAPAPGAAPLGGLSGATPSGRPVEDAGLPLEQMRPKIENGRLVVLGPEGDPVPPYAFARAAAARPDALVGLPDGTTAPASRIAAVLGAQVLGRLGEAEQGAGWILAMLRDGERREPASEDARRAEPTVPGAPESQLTLDAGAVPATSPGGGSGDREAASGDRKALDQASLDQAAACIELGPEALPRLELDLEELAASTDASLDLDFSADRFDAHRLGCQPGDPLILEGLADLSAGTLPAKPAAEAAAERDVDPDSIVLVVMRGVPEDAVLSTGVRDDDGTWCISPLDLSTVTIRLASRGSGDGAAGASRGADGELSITGIALAEDGELVTISEIVPLADYLADPAAGDPAGMQHGA
jgi:hypothetical protein